jgi:hypothetical protein
MIIQQECFEFFDWWNLGSRANAANEGHLKTAQCDSGTLTPAEGLVPFVGMSNVLSEEKRPQVLALGRLGGCAASSRRSVRGRVQVHT